MNGRRYTLTPVFPEEAIAARVREIAGEINSLYRDEPLVIVCVLKGGFMFFADLVKYITIKPELEFVRISSYGLGTESKSIGFTKDVELSLENKHVLLVEDVVDTGYSMQFLIRQLQSRGVKSLRLAALIDKRERREVDYSST